MASRRPITRSGDTGTIVAAREPAGGADDFLAAAGAHRTRAARAILTGLDELFTVLPNPAEQTSSMVLITGPSRTADIEQILVRGSPRPPAR